MSPCQYFVCSIWTVDLAYLLHKYLVKFSFFTVTVGANPSYSVETFYQVISYHILWIFLKGLVVYCYLVSYPEKRIKRKYFAILVVAGDYKFMISEFILDTHVLVYSEGYKLSYKMKGSGCE